MSDRRGVISRFLTTQLQRVEFLVKNLFELEYVRLETFILVDVIKTNSNTHNNLKKHGSL